MNTAQILDSVKSGSNSKSITYQTCDFGPVTLISLNVNFKHQMRTVTYTSGTCYKDKDDVKLYIYMHVYST